MFTADLVTFTEEILNGKLHFLRSDTNSVHLTKSTYRISLYHLVAILKVFFLPLFIDSFIYYLSIYFLWFIHLLYGKKRGEKLYESVTQSYIANKWL